MTDVPPNPRYHRILLKISGEALGGGGSSIDPEAAGRFADAITDLIRKYHTQIALVVGGGNIFRGIHAEKFKLDRNPADAMGMLATVINSIALAEFIRARQISVEIMAPFVIPGFVTEFSARTAMEKLDLGCIMIFGGGTGHPFFSTDTAAALRALQIKADILIKGTKVDGVYSEDPVVFESAERFDKISYQEVLNRKLKVMDSTSITLCQENRLPVLVLNLTQYGTLERAVRGDPVGTIITKE
ncbi:UMP kinase [bacterium]|nr:UMP kinase [candidate division CSSED10-310 bacterium]